MSSDGGYCRKYCWRMTKQEVEKMGCLDSAKQHRNSDHKCKNFSPAVFSIPIQELLKEVE